VRAFVLRERATAVINALKSHAVRSDGDRTAFPSRDVSRIRRLSLANGVESGNFASTVLPRFALELTRDREREYANRCRHARSLYQARCWTAGSSGNIIVRCRRMLYRRRIVVGRWILTRSSGWIRSAMCVGGNARVVNRLCSGYYNRRYGRERGSCILHIDLVGRRSVCRHVDHGKCCAADHGVLRLH